MLLSVFYCNAQDTDSFSGKYVHDSEALRDSNEASKIGDRTLRPRPEGSSESQKNNEIVTEYLIDYGYLEFAVYTKNELKRALRHFQRENNLNVNGKITSETINFINHEKEKQFVVNYLKKFNYIQGHVNPVEITKAVKLLQHNSGVLNITGIIDSSTISFVKNNQRNAYPEPPLN